MAQTSPMAQTPAPTQTPATTQTTSHPQTGAAPPRILPLGTATAPRYRASRERHPHERHHAPLPAPAQRPAAPRLPRHPRAACAPAPGSRAELAGRFALRLTEVLTGVRPAGQLTRHTTHEGYRELARLVRGGPLRGRGGAGRPQLGPVHAFSPAPGALEVCVRVESGARHHMVAFRLEQHHATAQWQCAAVEAR